MLNFGNKIENNGATPSGKLSAEEFNQVVRQINRNEETLTSLNDEAIKTLKLNGVTYQPDENGLVEAVINIGTTMNVNRKKGNIIAKLGSKIFIEYSFMSVSALGSTGKGEATYYYNSINSQPLAIREIDQSQAVDDYSVRFEVTDYITATGSYDFIVVVRDSQGNQNTIKYTVEAIEFTIKNLFSQEQTFLAGKTIPYRYGISGSGSAEKTVYFYITCRETGEKVLAYTTKVTGSDTASLGQSIVPDDIAMNWTHGAYTLTVYATIADGEDMIYSNTLCIDLIVRESGNTDPIVSLINNWEAGYDHTAKVYETIHTSVVVYTPGADTSTVALEVNDETISTIVLDNLTAYDWAYTIEQEYESLILSVTSGFGYAALEPIRVSSKLIEVEETKTGLALKLSSRGMSNDDADREVWESVSALYGTYRAQFSGFNWSSNGWINDSEGARALHITNGARVVIPFKVFDSEVNTTINNSGRTIEFEFKANNATDYDTYIISCFENGIGFYVTPRYVYFQNSAGEASSLSTYYKEGERVRVGFVFQSLTEGGGMFLYLNGKQSGYYTYEASHSFRQANPADIVVDSSKCDIDLYRVMIYNNALTKTQMVNNYITGKDSTSEMLTVFNRNDIFYNSQLSATLLQEQLPVMIMTASGLRSWMTQENIDKKMSIAVDIDYTDKADPRKSFTAKGAKISFQGTSSMGYPVRNFKIKLKGSVMTGDAIFSNTDKSKYRLRENSFDVGTFCLKADFAESSGAHNTGAARLINSVLTRSTSGSSHPFLTPPQAGHTGGKDVRTTVDGFPIVLFSRETETGDVTFVGKYNFNNDKSTQEVFGFEGIEGYNADMTNRTEILPEADDYRTATGDINSKSTVNPCECWEFKSNDVDLCKFKFSAEEDLTPAALKTAFESRYPEEYAAPSDVEEAVLYEDTTWGHFELKKALMWVHSTDTTQATGNKLPESALYNGVNYLYDTPEYRRAKFKAEVSEHFNLNNLLSYFLLTDFLGAVDQRAKNQMMASWGNEGSGDFKWYFIFYDNDTILGINNTGKLTHDYDLTSNTTGGYSGRDSVLWLNLEACFYEELCNCWGNLIGAVQDNVAILSYENCLAEFNTRQSDKWAESVFNEDSNYKYIYQGGAVNKDSDYYTVLQGSRGEHRKYWLYNRLQWINGKYKSKSFLAEGTGWRCNKVDGVNGSESLKLRIQGIHKQYYGYIIGNTTNEVFLLNPGEIRLCEYTGGWDYTNLNFAGEEYITDFGEVSHQLPSDLKISKMVRLQRLILSSERFQNGYLTNLSLVNKPFLEYLDISYAYNLSVITDAAGCYRLKRLLAFRSGLRETPFADGANLEYAELPRRRTDDTAVPGIGTVTLKNLKYLTFDNLKFEDNDYTSVTSLYVENCPGIEPLRLIEKVYSNSNLIRIVVLNIEERVTYESGILNKLSSLALQAGIPSTDNRITGTLHTDSISNMDLGILEAKYSELQIRYEQIISVATILITSENVTLVYEGKQQRLTATVLGTPHTEIIWSIVSGSQYASVDSEGIVTATEQRSNRNYEEVVVVRATLAVSKYVYSDYRLTISGVAATGGVIEGDTWLSSHDGSRLPVVSNHAVTLQPDLCTKRITSVRWYKESSDPNYSLYEIDEHTGVVRFISVKAATGVPIAANSEFSIQIYADFQVFDASLRTTKTLYVDYPQIGDYVYSDGSHSDTFYYEACLERRLTLIGVCFYVNKDRSDREMVAVRNADDPTHNIVQSPWGVGGYDILSIGNRPVCISNDNGAVSWGTSWQSVYNGDPDSLRDLPLTVAIADLNGKENTSKIIAEREYNGYTGVDVGSDVEEYPAGARCQLAYGDDSWSVGKKGEWWLPAAGELVLIWMNLIRNTPQYPNPIADRLSHLPSPYFYPFSDGLHWSSTEASNNNAVSLRTNNGYVDGTWKRNAGFIRAVSIF